MKHFKDTFVFVAADDFIKKKIFFFALLDIGFMHFVFNNLDTKIIP